MKFNCRINQIICIISIISFLIIQIYHAKECGTIDVRNTPKSLEQLRNCTVIKGYLRVVLIQRNGTDFLPYSFPELKEITEFLIIYEVYGLRSLSQLFPNLAVIRGEKLLLNYALGIDGVPHLNDIGLISLVAIQRGHIYINRCPMLCYVNTIDWHNITQSTGTNFIKQQKKECPTRNSCRGCRDNTCWSSHHCQKFKDDNLLKPMKKDCHHLCLGGCINSTAAGCNVCKGISDQGVCIEKCPSNKLLFAEYFRCYNPEVCKMYRRFIYNGECVKECPAGFSTTDFKTGLISHAECFPCQQKKCPRVCDSIEVQHLSDAENLKGCTVINGPLQIRITNQINEDDLKTHLSGIEEIYGYLKIYRTISITSLSFLRGLNKIHGNDLEYNHYSLIIYDNQNLVDLWPSDNSNRNEIHIANGGIFIHSNYKLCTMKIKSFQNRTIHDKSLDFVQKNEVEPSCNPTKLETSFEVTGFDSVTIRWKQFNISWNGFNGSMEYILFYREAKHKNSTRRDVDNTCVRDMWITEVLLPKDLKQEDDYFVHDLIDLKQYTQYAFYIKTYLEKGDIFYSTQSEIQLFTTQADIPTSQIVSTLSKTTKSLTLTWVPAFEDREMIDYYVIDMFKEPDKKDILDTRDYCIDQLILVSRDPFIAETKNCCISEEELIIDDYHFETEVGKLFQCTSAGTNPVCKSVRYSSSYRTVRSPNEKRPIFTGLEKSAAHDSTNYLKSMQFGSSERTSYTITDLEPFKLYTIQFFACNHIAGCGSYFIHSDRTAADPDADIVKLAIGEFDDSTNRLELMFEEPKNPNGQTVGYNINFKKSTNTDEGFLFCITRWEHELAEFRYQINLERVNYKIRIRSISLAGYGPYTEWTDVDISKVMLQKNRIGVFWYLLGIAGMILILYFIVKYHRKRGSNNSHMANAIIRYEYSDRDELLHGF